METRQQQDHYDLPLFHVALKFGGHRLAVLQRAGISTNSEIYPKSFVVQEIKELAEG